MLSGMQTTSIIRFFGIAALLSSSSLACSGAGGDGTDVGGTADTAEALGALHKYETENGFAPSYGWVRTIADGHASNGKAVEMLTNSLVFVNYENTVTRTKRFHVAARGSSCDGWPNMNLWIVHPDGRREGRGTGPIDAPANGSYQEIDFGTFTIQKGLSQIAIEFPNDHYEPGQCDRNLYVDYVAVRDL